MSKLAHILEMANLFDEDLEAAPYGDCRLADLLEQGVAAAGPISFVLPHLRQFSRSQLLDLTGHLPVFPAVAAEVIRTGRQDALSFDRVVQLASSDQTLAGHLIQASNTAAFSTVEPVRDLRRAVMILGTDRASRILVVAAMKPLLTTKGVSDLWHHSLVAARVTELIATRTSVCPTGDAYLLGLIHDVGRLLLRLAPNHATAATQKLMDSGYSPDLAELLICGATHSQAGGSVLRHWGLPQEWTVAVDFHHEPEHCDSPLAAMLYIAEHLTESAEDLPSIARLNAALQALGWQFCDLRSLEVLADQIALDAEQHHTFVDSHIVRADF
jgi:HD-like signal output (HDOD) protein